MELDYTGSEAGKKKVRKAKGGYILYIINILIISAIYIFLFLDASKSTVRICITVLYILLVLIYAYMEERHIRKFIAQTYQQELCIDGFIDLNIWRSRIGRITAKIMRKRANLYVYSMQNVAAGYIYKGQFEQAKFVIQELEKLKLDNTQKAFLISDKAQIAYWEGNRAEFQQQMEAFNKLSDVPVQVKDAIRSSRDLENAVMENNINRVNEIFDEKMKGDNLCQKVKVNYCKGQILEYNNQCDYGKYYLYAAENGKDTYMAELARRHMGIAADNKTEE
ncbi:MAG: hypothetical protein ACI4EF_07905 [Coprococcus sp.]